MRETIATAGGFRKLRFLRDQKIEVTCGALSPGVPPRNGLTLPGKAKTPVASSVLGNYADSVPGDSPPTHDRQNINYLIVVRAGSDNGLY